MLEGAKRRGRPPDHVLLSGPPGLGKTSLALIIGSELGTSVKITSGPAIERSGDLAAMLSNLAPGDVLFIDEIHRIARPAEELLYMAMEDFRVDVVVGKGPGATAIPLEINPFTLVGATTRAGLLTGPLRDRFGFVGQMEFYEPAELQQVLARSAALLGRRADRRRVRGDRRPLARHPAHRQPAAAPGARLRRGRGRRPGHPRRSPGPRSPSTTSTTSGLDRLDRAVLEALVVRFGGGPVGVATLAVAVGEEPQHRRGGVRAVPRAGRACSPARPADGWPPRPPGGTSASPLPRGGALLGGAGGAISGPDRRHPGASSEPLFDA